MVIAARKTLTWATLASAVVSAVLLACVGAGMPRVVGLAGDVLRPRPAASIRVEADDLAEPPTTVNEAARHAPALR